MMKVIVVIALAATLPACAGLPMTFALPAPAVTDKHEAAAPGAEPPRSAPVRTAAVTPAVAAPPATHNGCSEPHLGMTYDAALQSCWGRPLNVNRSTAADDVQDQAIYPGLRYLYFKQGVLIGIQQGSKLTLTEPDE